MSKEFNEKLDQLLKEVPLGRESHDQDPLFKLARQLRATDLSHRSDIQDSLREDLIIKQHATGVMTIMNALRMNKANLGRLAAALTLAVILSLVLLVGPGQTRTMEVLARFGLVTVTNEEREFEVDGFNPAEPTATPISPEAVQNGVLDPTTEEGLYVMATAEEAAEVAGFDQVYEPAFLPEGYVLNGRKVFAQPGGLTEVNTMYINNASGDLLQSLSITQIRDGEPFTYETGPATTTENITIAGYDALLIRNADLSLNDGRLFTIVVIQVEEYTLLVLSPSLSAETVVNVAASLFE